MEIGLDGLALVVGGIGDIGLHKHMTWLFALQAHRRVGELVGGAVTF